MEGGANFNKRAAQLGAEQQQGIDDEDGGQRSAQRVVDRPRAKFAGDEYLDMLDHDQA